MFYHLIKIPLITLLILLSYHLFYNGKTLQHLNEQNALQRDASRGIFNVDQWRCKLIMVIQKRIKTLDFQKLSRTIKKDLITFYKQETKNIRKQEVLHYNSERSFFDNMGSIAVTAFDKVKTKGIDLVMKKGGDYLSKKIGENQRKLQKIVATKTTDLINDAIKSGHGQQSCETEEITIISTTSRRSWQKKLLSGWWLLFGLITLITLMFHFRSQTPGLKKWTLIDLSLLILLMLFLGIMLPMMEINATLLNLQFTLLDQPIAFTDQSLYFREKSIYDIVTLLLPVNPVIGIAVLVFSVLFPLLKLIATITLLISKRPLKPLKGLILHLGKWSMADVFLVAIFLANLSFQNILADQLAPLTDHATPEVAINTSHSTIQIGFYFFFGYCMLSMMLALITKKYLEKRDSLGV